MKNIILITIMVLSFSFIVPNLVQAKTVVTAEVQYRAVLLELIAMLQKQIIALQIELAKQKTSVVVVELDPNSYQATVKKIAEYTLNNPSEISQIKNSTYRAYFSEVLAIFPAEYDAKLSKLMVFKGAGEEMDAFVETLPPNHTKWVYAVADDILEEGIAVENTELIVHELGHLISYEAVSEIPELATTDCHTYFKRHGCPLVNSYLGQFVRQFWSTADLTQAQQFNQAFNKGEAIDDFYKQNTQKFVNDYAASSPEEDFAESFMYFVTDKNTSSLVAKQKINFFRQYFELSEIKTEVIANIED